eukprot:gb/GFBE01038868.1/.p1 GENE.gb/GFBE01038868.1/~~gb/GFBE01038868.1/.p1  ORF type:complete len:624 (+),score=124.27 gb/GFBE01038868.1/:1-1872(+)
MQNFTSEETSIHGLLEAQMNMIQQVMALNCTIAQRATSDKLLAIASTARSASNSPRRKGLPQLKPVEGVSSQLAEPLLSTQRSSQPQTSARTSCCDSARQTSAFNFNVDETMVAGLTSPTFGQGAQSTQGSRRMDVSSMIDARIRQMPEESLFRSRAKDFRARCRVAASRLLPPPRKMSRQAEEPELEEPKAIDNGSSGSPSENSDQEQYLFHKPDDLRKHITEMFKGDEVHYDVEELYHETGICQSIVRSNSFKNFTFVMIIFSTLWIAIDTDYNTASVLCNAPLRYQIADNFICGFFFFELVARFCAFRQKCDAFSDWAFLLDFVLVFSMMLDTWVLVALYLTMGEQWGSRGNSNMVQAFRALRLLRIMRALRMSRVFRSLPELMVLVSGMVMAIRSVVTTLMMLLLVTYTFAIVLTTLFSGTVELEEKFGSVIVSTNYLLLQVLCGWDAGTFQTLIELGSVPGYALLMVYLLLGSLTIMNMLVGILVDVVGTAASEQDEEVMLKELKQDIAAIVSMTDKDGDNTVTQSEFNQMIHNPKAIQRLSHGGVNVYALADFAKFFFRDCAEMTLEEFVDAILKFRGSAQASGKDLVDLRVHVSQELARLASQAQGPGGAGSTAGP